MEADMENFYTSKPPIQKQMEFCNQISKRKKD